MVDETVERCGGARRLVNNAGLYASLAMRPFTEIPLEEWRQVMDVNVASMFLTCRAAVPVDARAGRRRRSSTSRPGTPFRGVPFLLHYVTSKGAIVAFTRALAKELGKDGVLVNCVAPGFTMSDGVKEHPEVIEKLRDVSVAARTIQRDQEPEDVVGAVVYLCGPGRRLRHRPDDRHRRRPVLPLRLSLYELRDGRRDERRQPRRLRRRARRGALRRGARRRAGARLAARRDERRRGALALAVEVELDPCAAWLVRCDRDRLPARRRRVPPHAPGARDPLAPPRRDRDRAPAAIARLRAGRARGSRAGREPVARDGVGARARRRSSACCCSRASGRASGRSATSTRPTRRSRSSSARPIFLEHPLDVRHEPHRRPDPRRPARACTASSSRSASRARATSTVLDALHDSPIRYVTCRHEAGAANMAEAYGKLTGRPGICFVTRGPGRDAGVGRRAHRLPGLDAADPPRRPGPRAATPGARRSRSSTTDAMFGPLAKWVAQVDDAERHPGARRARVPRRDARAARARSCSRCRRTCSSSEADVAGRRRRTRLRRRRPAPRDLAAAARAARGGRAAARDRRRRAWSARRRRDALAAGARRAASRSRPRCAARTTSTTRSRVLRGPSRPRRRPGARATRLRDADVAARRRRAGSATSRPAATRRSPSRRRTDARPRPSRPGRARPRLRAGARRSSSAGAALRRGARAARAARRGRRGGTLDAAHAAYLATLDARAAPGRPSTSATVMASLRERLAGRRDPHERRRQLHRLGAPLLRLPAYRTQLAPLSGAMGYGLPAAIAAKLVHPDRASSASPATATS